MTQVSLRYPAAKVMPRILKLLPLIQAESDLVKISVSKVLLMALLEGIPVLEQHYGVEKE